MTTVYLDESGDLGFDFSKPRTSRYFVVTALVCDDPRLVARAVKKVFAGFTQTQVRRSHGVLHAYKEDDRTRRKLLGLLAGLDVRVVVMWFDKRRTFTDLTDDAHGLYSYLVNVLLDHALGSSWAVPASRRPVRLVASRRETKRLLNEQFVTYLREHVRHTDVDLTVEIADPSAEKGLQAADCLAWSFFRKFEYGDPRYAQIVASVIEEETRVFG
ncbi:MAG: DUF3800 domain-containing protein [Actinomycetia bacterium]|nr:DUF3800 domain-containing protein [Actinomycetes bacterium]